MFNFNKGLEEILKNKSPEEAETFLKYEIKNCGYSIEFLSGINKLSVGTGLIAISSYAINFFIYNLTPAINQYDQAYLWSSLLIGIGCTIGFLTSISTIRRPFHELKRKYLIKRYTEMFGPYKN